MANKRIQDLEQTTDLTNDDLIPLDTTKKTFATTLKSLTEWLKNTFQTKDNLEQALSDATDKYPSSKVLKDESSRIVSVMDTKVNKSGDTMTGHLKVGGQIWVTGADGSIELIPSNSDALGGLIDFHFAGSLADFTSRLIERQAGLIYESSIEQRKTGEILTTVSLSSGYVRFGNGLQICWGNSPVNQIITLPQAFKNNTYRVTFCQTNNAEHNINNTVVDKTTTSFKFNRGYQGDWIAIGWWY